MGNKEDCKAKTGYVDSVRVENSSETSNGCWFGGTLEMVDMEPLSALDREKTVDKVMCRFSNVKRAIPSDFTREIFIENQSLCYTRLYNGI